MRAVVPSLLVLVALAGCGGDRSAAPQSDALANLLIRVDENGPRTTGKVRERRLRCERAGQSRACRTAARVTRAELAPTPKGVACAQIFGGPQTARVTGTLRGAAVHARFSRTDSCETARWNRVRDLLDAVR